jgi:hypothetical protein
MTYKQIRPLVYYTPIELPQYKGIGATEQEINNLEINLKVSLPYSYKLFLSRFGISADITIEGNPLYKTNLTGPVYDIYSIYKLNRYLRTYKSEIPIRDSDFVYLAYRLNTYELFSLNVFDVNNPNLNCRQLSINYDSDWRSMDLDLNINGHLKCIYPGIF